MPKKFFAVLLFAILALAMTTEAEELAKTITEPPDVSNWSLIDKIFLKMSNGHCTIPDFLVRKVFKDPISGKFAVLISLNYGFMGTTETGETDIIGRDVVIGWRDELGKFRVAVRALDGGWGFGQGGYVLKPIWKVGADGSCEYGGVQIFTFDDDGRPMSELYETDL